MLIIVKFVLWVRLISRTAKMSDNLLTETCMDSCDIDFENELLIHAQALSLCNISLHRSSGDDICNNYDY